MLFIAVTEQRLASSRWTHQSLLRGNLCWDHPTKNRQYLADSEHIICWWFLFGAIFSVIILNINKKWVLTGNLPEWVVCYCTMFFSIIASYCPVPISWTSGTWQILETRITSVRDPIFDGSKILVWTFLQPQKWFIQIKMSKQRILCHSLWLYRLCWEIFFQTFLQKLLVRICEFKKHEDFGVTFL